MIPKFEVCVSREKQREECDTPATRYNEFGFLSIRIIKQRFSFRMPFLSYRSLSAPASFRNISPSIRDFQIAPEQSGAVMKVLSIVIFLPDPVRYLNIVDHRSGRVMKNVIDANIFLSNGSP